MVALGSQITPLVYKLPKCLPPLSVQKHKVLQALGYVALVDQPVVDDGSGGQALQRGVVDRLDEAARQLLLAQQVAGRLPRGVGAVKVRAAVDQQAHQLRLLVGGRHVQWRVVLRVAAVHVCAALQEDGGDLQNIENILSLHVWMVYYSCKTTAHIRWMESDLATLRSKDQLPNH